MILKVTDFLHYLLFSGIEKVRVTGDLLYRYDPNSHKMFIASQTESQVSAGEVPTEASELKYHDWYGVNTDGHTHWGQIVIPKMSHGGEESFLCGGDVFILNDDGDTIEVSRVIRSKPRSEIMLPHE